MDASPAGLYRTASASPIVAISRPVSRLTVPTLGERRHRGLARRRLPRFEGWIFFSGLDRGLLGRGLRPSTRARGAAPSLPLLIGSRNGRQDHARPRFARGLVARLHSRRLGCGSRCLRLGLRRACCGRRSRRRSTKAPALTWTARKRRTWFAGRSRCLRHKKGAPPARLASVG
jgi:hypothetical protein